MSKKYYRPPVVVVLGHVDHGKTTLLDKIRKTNKADKEAGSITQDIGAYEVSLPVKDYHTNKITFIDTPGHEAFTKLRLRGADAADIAVLVVDAVDSVMPQTVESLAHIKNAKIPFVVAINKVDLPGAKPDKVKKDLIKEGVTFDGMGGDTHAVEISAKKGTGIDEMLETILFIASDKRLTYSPDNSPQAFIIESKKEKAGIVVSSVIKDGTLAVGDTVHAYSERAKIKALINDSGKHIKKVVPSMPFMLLGFSNLPEVGAPLTKEKKAQKVKGDSKKEDKALDMEEFFGQEKTKKLKVIIKADSQGSLDAVLSSLQKSNRIEVIMSSLGGISKSDVFLAKVSRAIIVGFMVDVNKSISDLADQESIVIKTYDIIYQLLEEIIEVSNIIEEREKKEKHVKGEAKILASFIIEKEKVAGIKVTKGKINLKDKIELYRAKKVVGKADIVSLKTRAKNITELKKNSEGGAILNPELDFSIGDVIKSYSI